MNYRRHLILDILKPAVAAMTFPVIIKTAVNNGNGIWTLTCCNIYHAQAAYTVVIGGNNYVIQSVNYSTETMVVKGSANIVVTTFNMYTPFFFHGTPVDVTTQLSKVTSTFKKTPMIWVNEIFEEEYEEDIQNPIERISSPEIYCLTFGDFSKTNSAIHQAYIIPMIRLAEEFIRYIKKDTPNFSADKIKVETKIYAKLGVYITNKGMDSSLLVDNLSGQMLKAPLSIVRKINCPVC